MSCADRTPHPANRECETPGPHGAIRENPAIGHSSRPIRIGTRASKLALTQSRWVADRLAAAHPGLACQLVHITTSGDRQATQPLPQIGGKGLFTRELEEALLRGDIDLAVHSLKDLPTQLPPGLVVASVPVRAPANDALIAAERRSEAADGDSHVLALPPGARVGTSSPRRAAQLRLARADLVCLPIRGNLDTRLRKLAEGQADAIVLALAGLARLGLVRADAGRPFTRASIPIEQGVLSVEALPFEAMLPAPGQGALGIEGREESEGAAIAAAIADPATTVATVAERALLDALGGGCSMPLGAYADLSGDALRLRAILFSPDGSAVARADRTGPASDPVALARAVAHALR